MEIGGKSMAETALLYAMASDKMGGGGWGGYMEDDQLHSLSHETWNPIFAYKFSFYEN